MTTSMHRPEPTPTAAARGLPAAGWLTLALSATMAALWSSHKLLTQDEIFSLQTDRVHSLAEVLRIQRLYPISLEPPPYHVLAHAAIRLFGPTAFALRLPAYCGYLLMQLCLYFFVRNLVGNVRDPILARRAGLIAMAFPALTWTLYYAGEGRPYGLLLGSYALCALCWQYAARRRPVFAPAARTLPLLGLTAALALTLTVHFYGVLVLIPLCGAELLRSLARRRLDLPMLAAILVGMASLALTLPYVRASSVFKQHYYAGPVSPHMLTQPYRQMLVNYTTFPHAVQIAILIALLVAALLVVRSAAQVVLSDQLAATPPELFLIVLLVALPVFAFLLGRFVTHALEVRHSIGAILGITALVAIALVPALRSRTSFRVLFVLILVGILAINTLRTRAAAAASRDQLAADTLTPAEQAAITTLPDQRIYFQNLGQWEAASLYTPNPALRSRLTLVYSLDEEMQHQQHDTMYLTATHTQHFSTQPIVAYSSVRSTPGDHLFVLYHSGWDWTDAAFATEATRLTPLGPAFGGTLTLVHLR